MGDTLKKSTKAVLGLILAIMPMASRSAVAESYILPIEFSGIILKIFIDNGSARKLSQNAKEYVYQLDMEDGVCTTDVTIVGVPAEPLRLRYDLCAGKLLSSNFAVSTEPNDPAKR
ncbi:hypothetical protein DevBK_01780 [Devosia sp. BK]|uniref:hypothetical protein n=1 Tax=Devosia sp. BK TaxID=2871706 RepID=UPI00293B1694|nr:hypothetical protein [Devosia sp. BK]MDV3250054.1 hypothetical protein [Devosia sp. BK]